MANRHNPVQDLQPELVLRFQVEPLAMERAVPPSAAALPQVEELPVAAGLVVAQELDTASAVDMAAVDMAADTVAGYTLPGKAAGTAAVRNRPDILVEEPVADTAEVPVADHMRRCTAARMQEASRAVRAAEPVRHPLESGSRPMDPASPYP